MALYTCGHIIPDSDSVCSAISLAYLLNKIGRAATPARQGELNPETKFILDKFGFEAPVLKTSFAGDELFITDYSDIAQNVLTNVDLRWRERIDLFQIIIVQNHSRVEISSAKLINQPLVVLIRFLIWIRRVFS